MPTSGPHIHNAKKDDAQLSASVPVIWCYPAFSVSVCLNDSLFGGLKIRNVLEEIKRFAVVPARNVNFM
jgi:hypothetical protein